MDPTDHDNNHAVASPQTGRVVRCPSCGGDSIYAPSNPARPFCSERCKNMDFSAWASENFRVAAPTAADELEMDGSGLQ